MNISHRVLRANLLRASFADLAAADVRLVVVCPRCRDRRELGAAKVVGDHHRGALPVRDAIPRLRCCSVPLRRAGSAGC
jgi:hypothetical protein